MRAPVSLEANRDPLAQVQNDDAVLVLGGCRFGLHSEFHFVRHHGPRIGRNAARNNTERSLFFFYYCGFGAFPEGSRLRFPEWCGPEVPLGFRGGASQPLRIPVRIERHARLEPEKHPAVHLIQTIRVRHV